MKDAEQSISVQVYFLCKGSSRAHATGVTSAATVEGELPETAVTTILGDDTTDREDVGEISSFPDIEVVSQDVGRDV